MFCEVLSKPIIAGAIAGVTTRYVTYGTNEFGQAFTMSMNTKFPFLNRFNGARVNLALVTAISVGISSLVSDYVADKIFTFQSKDEVYQNVPSAIFQLSSISAGTSFSHYLINSNSLGSRGVINIIGMATVSEAVSTYIYNTFLRSMCRGNADETGYDFADENF